MRKYDFVKIRFNKMILVYFLCFFIAITTSACGMSYKVKGRVLDAETGSPIEGAAVAVRWLCYTNPPGGLPTTTEDYGTTQTLSNVEGYFEVPKYPLAHHLMAVYKKGYICWSSEYLFNPLGKTNKEIYKPRIGHKVEDGMKIELEPFKEGYSRLEHALFVDDMETECSAYTGVFGEAIIEETRFVQEWLQNESKKERLQHKLKMEQMRNKSKVE